MSISDSSREWPHSPWEALEVSWDPSTTSNDGGQIGRIGLWEAIPVIDSQGKYARSINKYPAPFISEDISTFIHDEIENMMAENGDTFSPFEYEVDSAVFPEYYTMIQVPVYVDLIKQRLKNNYYRQVEFFICFF